MPHRPSLGLFDNEVRLYSLDELTETVRLLERSQPGPSTKTVYKRLTCEFACGTGRVAGSIAGLWQYGCST